MLEEKEFRKVCYEAARRTRGRISRFRSYPESGNFVQAEIAYPHRTAAVLWSQEWDGRRCEIFGIAEAPVGWGSMTFVDEPGLLAVLRELLPGHRLFTRAELEAPIDLTVPPWVNDREVRYWRPDNLGEVLFNYWD